MINGTELRVGNWAETYAVAMHGSWYDKDGKKNGQDVIEDIGIRKKQIDIEDLKIIFTPPVGLATYRPIPVTEEILLATGFKQGSVVGFYYLDIGNDTFLVSGGGSVWVEKAINFKEEEVSVGLGGAESIHQLQNLYYALCNKELDVKFETSGSNGI